MTNTELFKSVVKSNITSFANSMEGECDYFIRSIKGLNPILTEDEVREKAVEFVKWKICQRLQEYLSLKS